MSLEAAACAAAATELGYKGFAEIILERQLPPHAVATLFRHSAAKDGMTIAIVVLAAGIARHRAGPDKWNGDVEKALALAALHNKAEFDKAARRAAAIVVANWQEIAPEA